MALKKGLSRSPLRWRPTPNQVMILDELFGGGLRTPTAQQIQKITSQLKEYGKVECKNVFYWFQNHKAREKQKLRKKLHNHQQQLQHTTIYYYLNPQYTYGFLPMLPAQVKNGEWVSPANGYSPWPEIISLAGPDSDSDEHSKMRRPLKTLQLFPTTTEFATTTTTTTTTVVAASSSMSSSF